jgi:hypothetical protein
MIKIRFPRRFLGNYLPWGAKEYSLPKVPHIAQMPSAQSAAATPFSSKEELQRKLVEWVEEQEGRA